MFIHIVVIISQPRYYEEKDNCFTHSEVLHVCWLLREQDRKCFGELEDRRSIDAHALGVAYFYTRAGVRAPTLDYRL